MTRKIVGNEKSGRFVHEILFLIQSDSPYTPFSEESKQMIHTRGDVGGFELCQISRKILCLHCMKYLTEGIVYCDCGICPIRSAESRRLNKERYDVSTIPFFTVYKGANWRARHGRSEDLREHAIKPKNL